ncbi:MAG: GIY-YIG nuclease family protein [Deltaproteobacteria bacterium]
MDRKKELKQFYKEMKVEAGVYQVKNKKNQKIFVTSTTNLRTINGKKTGGFPFNKELQKEWTEYGTEEFEFEILEVLEKKEDVFFDTADALKKLEQKWLDKLQPYGDKGYNKKLDV